MSETKKNPKSKTQYKQVKLNFREEQYEHIDTLSKDENISMAQYCMSKLPLDLSDNNFRKRKSKVTKALHKKADPKLLFFLSNIANNINQLSKSSNKSEIDNDDILIELYKINTYIEKVKNDN